jgi:putative ABC transport system permease protein
VTCFWFPKGVDLGAIAKDLRYAVRSLWRTRGLSVVAVLCMGLGIGVCATLFASANPWLFRPLPYAEPDRLVVLRETLPHAGEGIRTEHLSAPDYFDWTSRSRSFAAFGAFERMESNLSTAEEPERVPGARVTAELFPMLGKTPVLGRPLRMDEDGPGGPPVALIGHALWQRLFAGDPEALGKTLKLDGVPHSVVGVMPPGFAFPEYAEVWTPLGLERGARDRHVHRLDVMARLRPGVTLEQARADLRSVAADLEREYPETNRGRGAKVASLLDEATPPGVAAALRLLIAAGLFVQLIACANVANLLLARAAARRKETAVCLALGAGRGRLLRRHLAEAVLLTAAGAVLGLLLAWWGMAQTYGAVPIRPPFWVVLDLDSRILGFTVAVTALSALLISLAPVFQARKASIVDDLKDGARTVAGGPRGRLGSALVVAELGLSLVLLVGATLLARSFVHRYDAGAGFETKGVLTARLTLSGVAYADPVKRAVWLEELVRRVRARPFVEDAGIANGLPFPDPLYGGWWSRALEVEGQPVDPERRPSATYATATAGYLRVLGLPLIEGRLFSAEEEAEGRAAVVVSDGLARRLWNGSAVSRRLRFPKGAWLEVVGVVREVKDAGDVIGVGARPSGQVYVPYRLDPWTAVSIVVRTKTDPASLATALREDLRALDPGLPLHSIFTLDEVRSRAVWVPRLWSRMLAAVAVFALLLAALGVYGVVSYAVSQRTHELGVRIAVGAGRGDVLRLVLGQGLRLSLGAAAVGLVGSIALSGTLSGLLYGVDPLDPATLLGCTGLLALVALAASCGPARRATRVDPLTALRAAE